MATPVFKFNHPDLPNEDLYFIQNTYYELPETIPMDLTTFVNYHFTTDRTFEGLFFCWDDLLKTGATLKDVEFEAWFNEEEKSKLYQDASASSALQNAIENKLTSEIIKGFIQEKKYEQENFESFFFELIESNKDNFRGDEYYQSRHYLFHHFQTLIEENQPNYNEEREPGELEFEKKSMDDYEISGDFNDLFELQYTLEDIDIHNFDQEDLLISLYSNENTYIPLHLIPHKYRNSGFFRDECLNNEKIYLIPLPINDREILFKAIKQNGIALNFASEELKNDREVVLEAVKDFGYALKFASEKLRNDREIVLEAECYFQENSAEIEIFLRNYISPFADLNPDCVICFLPADNNRRQLLLDLKEKIIGHLDNKIEIDFSDKFTKKDPLKSIKRHILNKDDFDLSIEHDAPFKSIIVIDDVINEGKTIDIFLEKMKDSRLIDDKTEVNATFIYCFNQIKRGHMDAFRK